jgi:hypothetical protein
MTEATPPTPKGKAAAEISRGFFDVQLRYVDVLAARTGMPFSEALTYHTNFHRFLGHGHLGKCEPAPEFLALANELAATPDTPARLDRVLAVYADLPMGWPFVAPPGTGDRFPFGCFACEAPDKDGVVHIHFGNRDSDNETGPLHNSKIAARTAELSAMSAFLASTYPDAKEVHGKSWLYNTDAYCRLFPADYAASRTPLEGPRTTHGLSTWGQFMDFRGALKPKVGADFLARLDSLNPREPWKVFPFAVLKTHAPFTSFRQRYGV